MVAANTERSDAEFSDFKLGGHAFVKTFVEYSVESCCNFVLVTTADLSKHLHINLFDEAVRKALPDGFIPDE